MKTKAIALLEGDSFNIKAIKSQNKDQLLFSDRDELFYRFGQDKYYYILKYGVICYFNLDDNEVKRIKMQILNPHMRKITTETIIFETVEVVTN